MKFKDVKPGDDFVSIEGGFARLFRKAKFVVNEDNPDDKLNAIRSNGIIYNVEPDEEVYLILP